MTNFPKDINDKILLDFKQDYKLVLELLSEWFVEMTVNYKIFEGIRITRCIILLADSDLAKLDYGIQQAKHDWRDVIVAAEYDKEYKQIRDMNKPFAPI